jgi:hypothetical protein
MMTIKELTIPLVRDVSYDRDESPLTADIPPLWYIISPTHGVIRKWGDIKWGGIIPNGIIPESITVILRNITEREY